MHEAISKSTILGHNVQVHLSNALHNIQKIRKHMTFIQLYFIQWM